MSAQCEHCGGKHFYHSVSFFLPIQNCFRCNAIRPNFLIIIISFIYYLLTKSKTVPVVTYKNKEEEFSFASYVVGCKVFFTRAICKKQKHH
jgi:hypothetical protein